MQGAPSPPPTLQGRILAILRVAPDVKTAADLIVLATDEFLQSPEMVRRMVREQIRSINASVSDEAVDRLLLDRSVEAQNLYRAVGQSLSKLLEEQVRLVGSA